MKIFCPGIYLVIIFGLVFWAGSRDLSRAASGEVMITHASMSTSSIPLWVAARQNFFSKYGVKTKTVWVRGNPAQIATLVSGDTQIAYGGAPTAMAAAMTAATASGLSFSLPVTKWSVWPPQEQVGDDQVPVLGRAPVGGPVVEPSHELRLGDHRKIA